MNKETYGQLIYTLEIIQEIIDRIRQSPNPAVGIIKYLGLTEWHRLNIQYKRILDIGDFSTISLLYHRQFSDIYDKAKKTFDNIIQEQLSAFGYYKNDQMLTMYLEDNHKKTICLYIEKQEEFHSFYKILWDQDPSFLEKYIVTDGYHNEELMDGTFVNFPGFDVMYEPINYQNDGINEMFETLSVYYGLWSKIVSYKDYLERNNPIYFNDIKDNVINDFKKYSLKNEKEILRQLKHKAQDFKEKRSLPLGPEQWGEMLAAEDDAFSLAIAGNLCQNEEERLSHIDIMLREQMEKNGALLQAILNVSRDEEVFDFEYANERHIDLYSKLTPDNLELFYDLILRRNIIQCEMFPALKSEYEAWLNGCDGDSGKSSESSSESETEVPACVSEVFNHTSDFVKNIVKKIIDSHYGDMPVNMALIEITLYDHTIIKKRNQHQKFIEALIAWGFFDEKKKENTLTGISTKFSALEKTGYKSWKNKENDQKKCKEIASYLDKSMPYRYKKN